MRSQLCYMKFSFYCAFHVVLALCHVYWTCDLILKSDNQIELISMLGWSVIIRLNYGRMNCYSCQLHAHVYYYHYYYYYHHHHHHHLLYLEYTHIP